MAMHSCTPLGFYVGFAVCSGFFKKKTLSLGRKKTDSSENLRKFIEAQVTHEVCR